MFIIGKLPATRGVWVIIGWANDERGHGPTKYSCKTLIGVHLAMHLMYLKVFMTLCSTFRGVVTCT